MAIVDVQSERYEEMVGISEKIIKEILGDVSRDVIHLLSVGFLKFFFQRSAWKTNQSKKAYALLSTKNFKSWELDAKAKTQMKADIYKHVETGTGLWIGLGSSSGLNLKETINFILIFYLLQEVNCPFI